MSSYKLLNKVCFRLSNKVEQLLNGITTNTLDKEKNAFLDRFGKLIVLVDQKKVNDEIYFILEEQYADLFEEHVRRYAILTKTKFDKLSDDVIHVFDEQDIGTIHFPQTKGYLTIVENLPSIKELSDKEYVMIRIENNIPIQGIDFEHQMFLDTGINAISFTKGCYLGQEVIARVHHKAHPGRKIVRILYEKLPEQVTKDDHVVGKITSHCFSDKYNKFLCFAMIKYDVNEVDDGEILDA